ncbi:MAG: hypothetical protein ACTSW4_01530 [Candidatus Ranarchaeia archaeon]
MQKDIPNLIMMFRVLYGHLMQAVSALDDIGHPSLGSFLRTFLWDTKQISEAMCYKKALFHVEQAVENIHVLERDPVLSDFLSVRLADPLWNQMWSYVSTYAFSRDIELLSNNAGARDVGQRIYYMAKTIKKILDDE